MRITLILLSVGLAMDAFAVSLGQGISLRRPGFKTAFAVAFTFGLFQALMPALGWSLGQALSGIFHHFHHWIAFLLLAWAGGKMVIDGLRENKTRPAGRKDSVKGVRSVGGKTPMSRAGSASEKASMGRGTSARGRTLIGKETFARGRTLMGRETSAGKGFSVNEPGIGLQKLLALAFATSIDAFAVGISLALTHADIVVSVLTIGIITFLLCFSGFQLGRLIGHLFGRFLENKATIIGGLILIAIGVKMLLSR